LLRQLRSRAQRDPGKREVAIHGVCLLVLVVLVAFAASSPVAIWIVLGMLWALDRERSSSSPARRLEADKADDEARERLLTCANNNRNEQEEPWKSDF
jgi:hypothetical protein